MAAAHFGDMPDGTGIELFTLAAGDLTVKIASYGAIIHDIRLAGVDHPLVLGFDRLEDYFVDRSHVGAVAGRYANRIAGGRLPIDGTVHQLAVNEQGKTHLHGGDAQFGRRPWRVLACDDRSVTLGLTSKAGEAGYPGNLEATIRYTVEAPATLRYEAEATADAPTVVNIAQHAYFNLDGEGTVLDHEVAVHADRYTPTDADKIPTGEIAPVAGTPFDLRAARPIRREVDGGRFVYDINYVVDMAKSSAPRPHARLASRKSGVVLDIASTECGVQFYDGSMMNVQRPGLGGRIYPVNGGCCFEPQFFPDSPNRPEFPSALLRPRETYRQVTTYAFSRT